MMMTEQSRLADTDLPLQGFKDLLRLSSGFADDGAQDPALLGMLRAAVAAIEGRTGKVLVRRSFLWTDAMWRDLSVVAIPLAPVPQIDSVTLVDAAGVQSVVPSDRYRLEADLHRPLLRAAGVLLPLIPEGGQAEVRLQAGFGASWLDIPSDLQHAVLMLAAQYHDQRDGAAMPSAVVALTERWRAVRLGVGAPV